MVDFELRRLHRIQIWLFTIFLVLFVLWASVFKINQVVRGSGEVIAQSRIQIIQAVDGGELEQILVREGDHVEKGEVIAVLDQSRIEAAVSETRVKRAALAAKAARLAAELEGLDTIIFPESVVGYDDVIRLEEALFKQRKLSLREEIRTLKRSKQLAKEEIGLIKQLEKTGDVNRSEVIRAEKSLNETDAKLVNRTNAYFEEASLELTRVADELAQTEQVLNQRMSQYVDSVFKAPVRGVVKNVSVTTVGGVLRAGEELLQIVPIGDELIIETKIPPQDIAYLQRGLEATIRFDPYDYTVFGGVVGEVTYISADTIKEDSRQGEEIYYRVHVRSASTPAMTTTGKELDIVPGMTAQVDIKVGDRTLLEYLLKPLRKTLFESLGER